MIWYLTNTTTNGGSTPRHADVADDRKETMNDSPAVTGRAGGKATGSKDSYSY